METLTELAKRLHTDAERYGGAAELFSAMNNMSPRDVPADISQGILTMYRDAQKALARSIIDVLMASIIENRSSVTREDDYAHDWALDILHMAVDREDK